MKTLSIIILGLLLSATAIWLGTFDPLWQKLEVEGDLRGPLTIATSIFFLLATFVLAVWMQLANITRTVQNTVKAFPQIEVLEMISGEEALRSLTKRISVAKSVRNTKLYPSDYPMGYSEDAMKKWHSAMRSRVRAGMTFREVVSSGWESIARKRHMEWSSLKGLYEVAVSPPSELPMVNFSIVTLDDGSKEVWFGWITSPEYGFDQPCFRSKEARLVDFFEKWFSILFSRGQQLSVPRANRGE